MTLQEELYESVVNGDGEAVKELTARGVAEGLSASELLNTVLIPAMTDVGQRFERQEFFVPEMLVAARAMKFGVEVLRPHLVAAGVKPIGTVVMGTVQGDLHDIGKNLVIMMLEGTGFRVVDLGVDVPADKFVAAIKEHQPDLVAMSALLTTTMMAMKAAVEALQKAGVRDQVKVMVGGAPLTQKFADDIGADIYAVDASSAARKAKEAVAG
ncbi:MAG: Methionine synthase [Chloroflexi bacterium ADurb.Bin180]|nr:MAG: Methionine synthase [Chloroflexi bacterium ADurb.Bin180]HNR96229.1 corrinoid protein [Anaerolineae bacterium]HOU23557.1 corrinoid protein [Anaerolineae bacterium]HQJ51230.1 corrinoid protein [Anaerolineae bacterium]